MAREKKKVLSNITLEQAQEASELYAQAQTKLSKLEAKMNEEINKVKSKYQDDITELEEQKKEPQELLYTYAGEQKDNWGKKKSFDLLHCIIGFRTGTPKLVTDKGWTLKAVTDTAVKLYPNMVRTKAELDKEGIIAMRDTDGFDAMKKECHFDVVQDETVFVEVKKEDLQTA